MKWHVSISIVLILLILPVVNAFESEWKHVEDLGQVYSIDADTSGVYAAGCVGDDNHMRIQKLEHDEGTIVWNKETELGSKCYRDIFVTSDSVYGVTSGNNQEQTVYFERRNKNTGDIIWEKDVNREDTNLAIFTVGMAADESGMYILHYGSSTTTNPITKRSKDTGEVVWSVTTNDVSNNEVFVPKDIAIDSSGIYIIGTQVTIGQSGKEYWIMRKINKDSGAIIWEEEADLTQWMQPPGDQGMFVGVDQTGAYFFGTKIREGVLQRRNLWSGNRDWQKTSLPYVEQSAHAYSVKDLYIYLSEGNRVDVYRIGAGQKVTGESFPVSDGETTMNNAIDVHNNKLYVAGYSDTNAIKKWYVEKSLVLPWFPYDNPESLSGEIPGESGGEAATLESIWKFTEKPNGNTVVADIALDGTSAYAVGCETEVQHLKVQQHNLETGAVGWTHRFQHGNYCYDDVEIQGDSLYTTASNALASTKLFERRRKDTGDRVWEISGVDKGLAGNYRGMATGDAGVYLAQFTNPSSASSLALLSKVDGAVVWSVDMNDLSGNEYFEPWRITKYGDAIFVIGSRKNAPENTDWIMRKYSLTGEKLAEKSANPIINNPTYGDLGKHVVADQTGVYFIGTASNDMYVEKWNHALSERLWSKYLRNGRAGNDQNAYIADGILYIAYRNQMELLDTRNGHLLFTGTIPRGSNEANKVFGVSVLNSNIYVGGSARFPDPNEWWLEKFIGKSLPTLCGDEIIEGIEVCDDGNAENGDGCSAECDIEDGWSCAGIPSECSEDSICGDNKKEGNEECDDGNIQNGDGCSDECKNEFICGDGTKEGNEECDDGNVNNGDGCSADCTIEQSNSGIITISSTGDERDNTCRVLSGQDCSQTEIEMLQLSALKNAHASWRFAAAALQYPYKVCCNFDSTPGEVNRDNGEPVVSLSDVTNAHAELEQQQAYRANTIHVKLANGADVRCENRNTCNTNEQCVVSLSTELSASETNLHLSSCTESYATQICCKISAICGNGVQDEGDCSTCFEDFCNAGQQCGDINNDGSSECSDTTPGGGGSGGGGGDVSCGNPDICEATDTCGCDECQVLYENPGTDNTEGTGDDIYSYPPDRESLNTRNPCGDTFNEFVCTANNVCECNPDPGESPSCRNVTPPPKIKAALEIPGADNVVSVTKIATYKGKPVKVNVVVWE